MWKLKMIKKIPFHVEHLKLINTDEYTKGLLSDENLISKLGSPADVLVRDAVTFIQDDRVIACVGYNVLCPGIADVWLFPSVYIKDQPITFVREVYRLLDTIADILKLHRIQTVTRNVELHRKWMNTLGFVEEGILKNFYLKQDYFISARYFEVK